MWTCPTCGGHALMLSVLRRRAPADFVRELWRAARRPDTPEGKPCPSCGRPAREVPGAYPVLLDVCPRCQLVWFDPMELDTVPRPAPSAPTPAPKVQEAVARMEAAHKQEMRRLRTVGDWREAPDQPWKYLPGLLGFPVEFDSTPLAQRPWATWGLAGLIALVGVLTFGPIDRIAMEWGLIAAQPFRHGGLDFVTSFFLHVGWLHLLGNLYFLVVFGDDVEGIVGWRRFLLLVFLSALVGDILHIALVSAPRTTPTIGASGGISGVLAFYALALPRARLGLLFWYFFWIRLPAWGFLAFWVGLQLLGVLTGATGVAYLAHLGGALAGVGLWFAWRSDLLGTAGAGRKGPFRPA